MCFLALVLGTNQQEIKGTEDNQQRQEETKRVALLCALSMGGTYEKIHDCLHCLDCPLWLKPRK
jgi:hypothetical protein